MPGRGQQRLRVVCYHAGGHIAGLRGQKSTSSRPSVVPPKTQILYIVVSSRRNERAGQLLGGRVSNEDGTEHVDRCSLKLLSVRTRCDCPSRPMLRTMPQSRFSGSTRSRISQARARCSGLPWLAGGCRSQSKNPPARRRAAAFQSSATGSGGQISSRRQKSCVSGAPSTAPPEHAAVRPGTASISGCMLSPRSSKTSAAMP